ncbi:MAG: LysM peptidoglycan-binding domain-containing protein [Anaerolineaceae bacterium]|nr:LysM peptidoglycan-binding domain-containing protein [Anaerolineaceae bacterium]
MMSPETNTSKTKLCPVCGTRLNESAKRCLVCGTELDVKADTKKPMTVSAKRLPEITLSLPAILGVLALFISLGAVIVFLILSNQAAGDDPEAVAAIGTETATPTVTMTPTVTTTPTIEPTWTPLPTLTYTVKAGETCSDVAAFFDISVSSIIFANNLSTDCILYENQELNIPQPTPTASPQPTSTLSEAEKTESACEVYEHLVGPDDTLSSIADEYDVSMATIREYNGLPNDTVMEGLYLSIPLCMREPTAGPTPTATTAPPYPGPNLLLPSDGASYSGVNETITLQWAAVSELLGNEAYAVTITDLTSEEKTSATEYVTGNSFIVPASFAPDDGRPHVYRWSVYIARSIGGDGTTESWSPAGNKSVERVFSWFVTSSVSTPTP